MYQNPFNTNKKNKLNFSAISFGILFLFAYPYLLLNQNEVFGENDTQQHVSIPALDDEDYNIVVAGDWYCNEETQKTINNIISIDPELIITTGDHVKDEKSADCWIEMSEPIKDKMKIAIGNHDAEFANIYKQIVNNHQLKSPYYSHDLLNIHFISMSTEHPFEIGSKQYEFIKSDLEKTSQNRNIDWIIVHQHKPLYSTKNDKIESQELRKTFQQLFQHHDVDLVISSHNQYYERTYPILFNESDELYNDESEPPKPIITEKQQSDYPPTEGIIYLTVGTAGDELHSLKENPYFYVVQQSKYGFLNINIENNGKTLFGEFIANDGSIVDQFRLHTQQTQSYLGDKILLDKDRNANNNLVACDKLEAFGKALFDEWELGQITAEQVLLLGDRAKKLMTEFGCGF